MNVEKMLQGFHLDESYMKVQFLKEEKVLNNPLQIPMLRMMKDMGYFLGMGVGTKLQGIAESITSKHNGRAYGLGYFPIKGEEDFKCEEKVKPTLMDALWRKMKLNCTLAFSNDG